jgi:hypothetical protein
MLSMLALVASLAAQEAPAEPTLLPGLADLPLLAGSRADPTCGGESGEINAGAGLACVANTGGDLTGLQLGYAEAALARGWRYSFIAQDVMFLERPAAGGKCEILSFNPTGDDADDDDYAPTGLAIIMDRDMPCVQARAQ